MIRTRDLAHPHAPHGIVDRISWKELAGIGLEIGMNRNGGFSTALIGRFARSYHSITAMMVMGLLPRTVLCVWVGREAQLVAYCDKDCSGLNSVRAVSFALALSKKGR